MCFVSTDCLLPNKGVKSLCRQGVNLRCRLTVVTPPVVTPPVVTPPVVTPPVVTPPGPAPID